MQRSPVWLSVTPCSVSALFLPEGCSSKCFLSLSVLRGGPVGGLRRHSCLALSGTVRNPVWGKLKFLGPASSLYLTYFMM